jgi:hypothetical protein
MFMGSYHMNDKDIFEQHMQQIRTKGSLHNLDKEVKIREERHFSRYLQEQLRNDRQKQEISQRMLKLDFIESNAAKKQDNLERRRMETERKYQETYEYFPFQGSDEVERRRHELKLTQRREFQQHLSSSTMSSEGNLKSLPSLSVSGQNFHKISPLSEHLAAATASMKNVAAAQDDANRIKMIHFMT